MASFERSPVMQDLVHFLGDLAREFESPDVRVPELDPRVVALARRRPALLGRRFRCRGPGR